VFICSSGYKIDGVFVFRAGEVRLLVFVFYFLFFFKITACVE
jgi:hypothetical protein